MGASRFHQVNTANQGSVYAVQNGDINISGAPGGSPPAGELIRVLMLAANPSSTGRLEIDEEARQITERLRLARDRDAFELITCLAVQAKDLQQYLNQHRPHIVHFSGHGDRSGAIAVSAGDGTDRPVPADRLAELLRATNDGIRVVVLNACHSAAQMREIGRHVDHVIGMTAPIADEAAIVFAASFYSALGFGRPVPQAFDQAVAVLGMLSPADRHIPELVARPGADPHLTLAPDTRGGPR